MNSPLYPESGPGAAAVAGQASTVSIRPPSEPTSMEIEPDTLLLMGLALGILLLQRRRDR